MTSQPTPSAPPVRRRRPRRSVARAARVTLSGLLSTVVLASTAVGLLAVPAAADVPEGWSDPAEVDMLGALLLLAGVPLLLFVLITLAVYLPSMIRGERLLPGHAQPEPVWIGGPRDGSRELAGPDDDSSQAGGARGRW